MPFKGKPVEPNFNDLLATLNATHEQTEKNPLWQVIYQFLTRTQRFKQIIDKRLDDIEEGDAEIILNYDFLTYSDEVANLPNSRNLLAGTGITFDDTVANERTVNVSGASIGYYEPVSSGISPDWEIVFATDGDVVMAFIP